ncbi:hypothetical protein ACTXT7_012989, partial [Hymenolepis weldensis]
KLLRWKTCPTFSKITMENDDGKDLNKYYNKSKKKEKPRRFNVNQIQQLCVPKLKAGCRKRFSFYLNI